MINNKIKQLRLNKNLSQEQLAEKAKVSVRTIQRMEAGTDTSAETLNLVAGALGVPVKELFCDSTDQEDKIKNAEVKLQYQLQSRRDEFKIFRNIYLACYVIVMMVWGIFFKFIHNDIWGLSWEFFGLVAGC